MENPLKRKKTVYTFKSGQIKDFVVGVKIIEVRTEEYTTLVLSLTEEMVRLQLMYCTLTNPSMSQFRTEIGLDGR